MRRAQVNGKVALGLDAVASLLRVLEEQALPPEAVGRLKQLQAQAAGTYPALVAAAAKPEELPAEDFSNDIEEEANSYYQRIYESEQLSIPQVRRCAHESGCRAKGRTLHL